MHSGRLLVISTLAVLSLMSVPAREAIGAQMPAGVESVPRATSSPPAKQSSAKTTGADRRRRSVFARVQGSALSVTRAGLPAAPVRLRDARFGRIVRALLTDAYGLFVFQGVDPGSYVVELLDARQQLLATSQLVSVNAAETASVVVREPLDTKELDFAATSVEPVTSAAAASGILASDKPRHDVSPR